MIDKILRGSEFKKNVATLITGTAIAQLIPFVISPIITRLYTPENLGGLSLFVSITAILAIFSTAKYDAAILLPKEQEKADSIYVLSNLFVFGFFLLLLLVSGILSFFFSDHLVDWGINEFIWYIPFMVLFLGSYQSMYYLFNRNKKYKALSFSRVYQNVITAASNILLGLFSFQTIGLIISRLMGQLVSLAYLFTRKSRDQLKINIALIKEVAHQYVRFPKFVVASQLINTLSLQMPVFLIVGYFGSLTLGLFALTQRVVLTPIGIVATSIGDVFRQQASEDYAKTNSCKRIYTSSLKRLFLISVIPFILFFFLAPWLFSFVFGNDWYEAGIFAQALTPMFFLQFIGKPLSSIFLVTENQNLELFWQILFLVFTILPFGIGIVFHFEIIDTLYLFAVMRSLTYIVLIVLGYSISTKSNRV